jgi:hypothetical protein
VAIVRGTQVVFVDGGPNRAAQSCAGILVGSKMDSAVDAGVGDVVGNLLKRPVLDDDGGHRGVGQRNEMPGLFFNSADGPG